MLNGKVVSMTKDGKKSMDFCQNLKKGNHVLEVFGATRGLDTKVTKWTFRVDKSEWMVFSLKTLKKFRVMKQIKSKTTIWFGKHSADQSSLKKWHTVSVNGTFNNPVVVMGPLSSNGPEAAVVRVKDVSRNMKGQTTFKWQIQEWSYLDNKHVKETVSFMVVESGAHQLPDGSWVVAGKTNANEKW
jgi:hypothetical protein